MIPKTFKTTGSVAMVTPTASSQLTVNTWLQIFHKTTSNTTATCDFEFFDKQK